MRLWLLTVCLALAGRARADTPQEIAAIKRELLAIAAQCAGGARCNYDESPANKVRKERAYGLIERLGQMGTMADVPFLVQLEALGLYGTASSNIRDRALTQALEHGRCKPPTAENVQRIATRLTTPTKQARADLAYFVAAVGGSVEPPDSIQNEIVRTRGDREESDQQHEARYAPIRDSLRRGDFAAAEVESRKYLRRFGFPGALRGHEALVDISGSESSSDVLRFVATRAENAGRYREAYSLLSLVEYMGGCGNCAHGAEARRVQEMLRVAEAGGLCAQAVAAELTLRSLSASDPAVADRLAQRGFDVERLWRGALVTLDRGKGNWAEKIRALVGYTGRKRQDAVPLLLDVLERDHASVTARQQAIELLLNLFGSQIGLGPEVRKLTDEEKARLPISYADLSRRLELLKKDSDPEVAHDADTVLSLLR